MSSKLPACNLTLTNVETNLQQGSICTPGLWDQFWTVNIITDVIYALCSTLLSLELISKSPILEGGTTSSLGRLDKCTTAPNTVRLKGPGRLSPRYDSSPSRLAGWPDIVKDFMSVSSAVMENLYLPAAG